MIAKFSILVLCAFMLSPVWGAPLDFSNFVRMKEGKTFKIRNAKEIIGKGKLVTISRGKVRFQFEINTKGQSIRADATLVLLPAEAKEYVIDLSYDGNVNGTSEKAREQVRADRFLAENGILTFHFLKGQRFFQLARNNKGESTITTDWGTGTIVPDR